MRILLTTLEYPPFYGGVANYYKNIAEYWPEANNFFVLDNSELKLVKKWPFLPWLSSITSIYSFVRKNKIDHIIVGQILPIGTSVWLLSYLLKIKYSVVLHGMDFTYALKNPRKKFLAKKILEKSDKIICGNSYLANLAGNFLGVNQRKKINIVNPGVNINEELKIKNYELRTKYSLVNNLVLLSVGRLVARKGFDYVLDCLPGVIKKIPNIFYVIVGKGEELTNLEFKIKNLKLENHTKIITDANNKERNAWYGACDIFIMPAREVDGDFEGFGIVYLEANLAGKPVIAGNSGGVGDAVEDGVNGLLVNPGSKDEIAQAIIKLAGDPNSRLKLGEQGRQRTIEKFNWKKQIEIIYKNISV